MSAAPLPVTVISSVTRRVSSDDTLVRPPVEEDACRADGLPGTARPGTRPAARPSDGRALRPAPPYGVNRPRGADTGCSPGPPAARGRLSQGAARTRAGRRATWWCSPRGPAALRRSGPAPGTGRSGGCTARPGRPGRPGCVRTGPATAVRVASAPAGASETASRRPYGGCSPTPAGPAGPGAPPVTVDDRDQVAVGARRGGPRTRPVLLEEVVLLTAGPVRAHRDGRGRPPGAPSPGPDRRRPRGPAHRPLARRGRLPVPSRSRNCSRSGSAARRCVPCATPASTTPPDSWRPPNCRGTRGSRPPGSAAPSTSTQCPAALRPAARRLWARAVQGSGRDPRAGREPR